MQHRTTEVIYRSPVVHTCLMFVVFLTGTVLYVTLAGAVMWARLFPALWPNQTPPLAHLGGFLALMLGPILLAIPLSRRKPVQLILKADCLWIGGFVFGRTIEYEEIKGIELHKPEDTVGSGQRLTIIRKAKGAIELWLSPKDGEECVLSLRDLCERSPTVRMEQNIDDRIEQIVNTPTKESQRQVMATSLHREGRRELIVVLYASLLTVAMAVLLICGASPTQASNIWKALITFAMVALTSMIVYVRARRRVRVLLKAEPKNRAAEGGDRRNDLHGSGGA